MANVVNWVPEVQGTVLDGMNRGVEPELINDGQAHLLRNVSIRGGRVRSRPRFVKRAAMPAGLLQGGAVFNRISTLLVSIGGKLYEVDPQTWNYAEKTSASDRNSPIQPRAYFCETVGTMVMQDSQSKPLIYDGATFRRAESDEVPVGRAMAYGNGRLAVVVNAGSDVRIGDIRKPEHQSELKFTETYSLSGGGDFAFPSEVTSLSVLPVIDTGSGQGSLVVGCRDSVHTLKTQYTERDLWSEIGIQTILLPNRGVAGPNAIVAVNQDLYFRSSDGLRSIRTSTADIDAPGLAPLSVEVRHRFDRDTQFLLGDASVVYFDNRLLCTHSPFVYGPRSLSQGLIALNFDAMSGRGHKSAPAFDGEWDGVLVAQLFAGNIRGTDRCFILGRDVDGTNGLWEILPETAQQVGDSPTQVIETRTLFAGHPGVLKSLRRCDLQFSEVQSDLTVRILFRPEKYPYWVQWDEFTVTSPATTSWGTQRARRSPILSTRTITDKVDEQTGRLLSVATGFQVRVEFEGVARLDLLQVTQEGVDGAAYSDTPTSGEQAILTSAPAGTVDPAFWYAHPVSPLAGIV